MHSSSVSDTVKKVVLARKLSVLYTFYDEGKGALHWQTILVTNTGSTSFLAVHKPGHITVNSNLHQLCGKDMS